MDEGTPHIHERHVFDCENQYGELAPQQEKALEELGFELPDPAQKAGKTNNRKKTFDAVCRTLLFDMAKNMACTWRKNRNTAVVRILKNRTIS